jgi:glyoxylase-like metal-dependent hydrolase (beta-lactamase superfamily II)
MNTTTQSVSRQLFALVIAIILVIAAPCVSVAQNSVPLNQPGYYTFQLGDFQVIALSDGTASLDFNQLLSNIDPKRKEQLFKENYLTTTVENSINGFLIKANDKLILVDAGTADAFGPTLGKLVNSLKNAGYKPEQIDAVLITHLHPDHIGGVTDGDKMVFPNAKIYISKPEAAYWLTEKNKTEAMKFYFETAVSKVSPYLKANKVVTFDYGAELFPGITPIACPGHTPGHTLYSVESKGQKLLFWGDLIHAAAVQLSEPSAYIQFDGDNKSGAAQRKKAYTDAAKNGYWIAADHISFPGIGHLRTDGTKYIWVPANYSAYTPGK